MSDRVILGHITGVHGIKGEVVVRTYTEAPESLGAYGPLSDDKGRRSFIVQHVRATPKGAIVRFAEVADRTAAEALKGIALTVLRSALPPTGDDEFYMEDLVGMTAVSSEGAEIGRVVAVQNFGAGDLLEIKLAATGKTEFVPFTDPHVPTIDIAAKRMTVVMPVMVEPEADEGQ